MDYLVLTGRWVLTLPGTDERAVSQQQVFGATPFQIMSGGLHGCTVVRSQIPAMFWIKRSPTMLILFVLSRWFWFRRVLYGW